MKVKIGNNYSETQNISFGFPQGLVLDLRYFKNIVEYKSSNREIKKVNFGDTLIADKHS